MALNKNDYVAVKNASNLFIHKKDKTKFLFDFRYDNKRYRKAYKVQATDWTKGTCIADAKKALQEYKNDVEAGFNAFAIVTLDKLFELYSETLDANKKWTTIKRQNYARYIQHSLGKKKIDKIREMDVKKIIAKMQAEKLSPRTQKLILEVLKPLFNFAITNKYMKENPIANLTVKIPNQKKVVTDATALFQKVHNCIVTYYKDEPFYQALFLFALTGRRKSEILNLKWKNIDFESNYYWIENTKNDDKQKYPLAPYIKDQILLIQDDRKGLVFKSPVTGDVITNTDRQMRQLKKHIGINNLSLHYMRNILVSMLAEQKTEAIVLSGILGHKDVNTINKYLSVNHYKSGQIGLDKIDDVLDVEILNHNTDN
ncbi:tyrosine-type recombinase/integrase [Sulfurimonas sp.]|uniref:tyrosine-type recombinase/integrase n=1 Tax=Sulfurimonas sp. TaxID=2022749 RepID=UPI00261DF3B8|nr:tyrosine-type recombinase/integrase [Sulfurimonas sp.]